MQDSVSQRLITWLTGEDTGSSSKAMARAFTHIKGPADHPLDPNDFGRCHKLLEAVPEVREAFPRLAVRNPVWKHMVPEWDRMTALYLAGNRAELYRLMLMARNKGDCDQKGEPYDFLQSNLQLARNVSELCDLYLKASSSRTAPELRLDGQVTIFHDKDVPVAQLDELGRVQEIPSTGFTFEWHDKAYAVTHIPFPCHIIADGREYRIQHALDYSETAASQLPLALDVTVDYQMASGPKSKRFAGVSAWSEESAIARCVEVIRSKKGVLKVDGGDVVPTAPQKQIKSKMTRKP